MRFNVPSDDQDSHLDDLSVSVYKVLRPFGLGFDQVMYTDLTYPVDVRYHHHKLIKDVRPTITPVTYRPTDRLTVLLYVRQGWSVFAHSMERRHFLW